MLRAMTRALATVVRNLLRALVVITQRWDWWRREVYVAHGSFVSKSVDIGRRTRVTGPSRIDDCEIGPYCMLASFAVRNADHDIRFLNMQEIAQRRVIGGHSVVRLPEQRIRIGAGVWIGDGAVVLKNVQIGDGAVIGAGAVVTRDVPAYAIAVGNPARVVRYRFSDEVREILAGVEWWTWDDAKLRANKELFETDLSEVDPAVLRDRIARL
jgi:virginiamycin A acetyltransferase